MKSFWRIALVLIFLLAVAFRVFLIFNRAPGGDEIWTFFLIKSSFKDIFLGTLSEMQLPFFFSFLHTLSAVTGVTLEILHLRLIALLFGILSSFAIAFLVTDILGKRAGGLAFLLSLFLPASIWTSVFGRYYSFLILLTALAILVFTRFLETRKRKNLLYLLLISFFGIYTHYYFLLLIFSFGVFLLLARKGWWFFKNWLYFFLGALVLFAPAVFYFFSLPKQQIWMRDSILKIPAAILANVASLETLFYIFYHDYSFLPLTFLALLSVALIFLLFLGLKGCGKDYRFLFLTILIFPLVAILTVSLATEFLWGVSSVLGVNSLLIFWPAFVALLAKGLEIDLAGKKILSVTFATLVLLSLFFFGQASKPQPVYTEPYQFLNQEFREGDLVLHADIYTFLQARYYLKRDVNFGATPTTFAPPTEVALGYKILPEDAIFSHKGKLWYFEPGYYNLPPARNFKAQLDKNFTLLSEKYFPESTTRVYLYDYK